MLKRDKTSKGLYLSDFVWTIFDLEYSLPLDADSSDTKNALLIYATILFAHYGYHGVSIKMVADQVGIKAASIYNHYESKDQLWTAVITHAKECWDEYFKALQERLAKAESFQEIVHTMLVELKARRNTFTSMAFSLLLTEQMTRDDAWEIVDGTFYYEAIGIIKHWFDVAVEKGYARPFPTQAAASCLMQTALTVITADAQESFGRKSSYVLEDAIDDFEAFMAFVGGIE